MLLLVYQLDLCASEFPKFWYVFEPILQQRAEKNYYCSREKACYKAIGNSLFFCATMSDRITKIQTTVT